MNFDGMEKDDEIKGKDNSLDFGARMYDSRLGRWMSLDPLAAKYPALSPYNFVANSPLIFIDPDGKEIRFFKSEVGMSITSATLDAYFSGAISFSIVGNKLQYTINDLSSLSVEDKIYAKNLIEAIESTDVLVMVMTYSIDHERHGTINERGTLRSPGEYRKAIYDEKKDKVTTQQEIVPQGLNGADQFHGKKIGNNILHELLESYEAGKLSLKLKKSDINNSKGSKIWKASHENKLVPRQSGLMKLSYYIIDEDGKSYPESDPKSADIMTIDAINDKGERGVLYGAPTK